MSTVTPALSREFPDGIEAEIRALHARYCELCGFERLPLRADWQRDWYEWLKEGNTLADLETVIAHIQSGIRARSRGDRESANLRNPGALKFSNLITQVDRFAEELAMARAAGAKSASMDPFGN